MTQKNEEFVDITLNFPNLKLNLTSKNPLLCLKELKKIVNGLNQNAQILEKINEEISSIENPEIVFNLEFSEEIRNNPEIVEHIDKLMQVEKGYTICKAAFPCKKIVDLDNKHATYELELPEAEKNIRQLFSSINSKNIHHTILLLKGEYTNKDKFAILERIKRYLPDAKVNCYDVKQPMFGKIAAEFLFFGDF